MSETSPVITTGEIRGIKLGEEDGALVRKRFGRQGWFKGRVVSYCTPWFRVNYSDGDFEDLTLRELKPILAKGVAAPPFPMKRPTAAASSGGGQPAAGRQA